MTISEKNPFFTIITTISCHNMYMVDLLLINNPERTVDCWKIQHLLLVLSTIF